jgi:hypothetical protein
MSTAPTELPPLAEFLRWIAEMPAAFSQTPVGFPQGKISVAAVVADLLDTLEGQPPEADLLTHFTARETSRAERNRLLWILAACHVMWHPALRAGPQPPGAARRLLTEELNALAALIPVERLRLDEERREELIRRTLRVLERRLPGESEADAEDRLAQVDSIERQRLIREAADKERRAREVREQMAREAAQAAANRYGTE